MPVYGGAPKCGRCGGSVYHAEGIIAADKTWHKRGCFTCLECNKSLESTTVAERKVQPDGSGGDIYCKACYGRLFGPKGYGYGGGAGALTNTGK